MGKPVGLLDASHEVMTPELVEFEFVLAGLYARFLAWLVDTAVVLFGAAVLMSFLGQVLSEAPGFAAAAGYVVYFVLDAFYATALEAAWSGRTVGKRLLGLRVIQETGVRIDWSQAVLRNLLRWVDRLPLLYLTGGLLVLGSRSGQRLGDWVAGTLVVRERRLVAPASLRRLAALTELTADPRFLAKVHRLPADDRAVVYAAALRREELGLDARVRLFAALADRLDREHGLYRPGHLSDEKFVCVVAAALSAGTAPGHGVPARPR